MSTNLRGAGIIGIGSYVPDRVITNADLEKIVDTTDEWILSRSGIRERRIAEGTPASELAVEASLRAMESASITPDQLDLIICATITGDMPFPSTACIVQDKLGANNAGAFDLQAGCSGWVYSFSVAADLVRAGRYERILVVGVDVLTSACDWSDRATCVLFGDGAGATIVGPVEPGQGMLSSCLGSDGGGAELLKIDAGGSKRPTSEQTVREGGHFIRMEGREVYKFAVKIMGEASIKALESCGLSPADVDLFVPHQANIRIIEAAAARLGLPTDKVFINVQNYGNTSGASIPLALDEAYRAGRIREGEVIVAVGFGAGLTWGSAVLTWTMPTIE